MRCRVTRCPTRFDWWVLSHVNKIGKNCRIHPTARIEGSVIGDNVRIGANCYIQSSNIGDDVDINDYAHIRLCSIGSETQIITREWISGCVLYPRVFFAGRYMQFGVIGQDAQVYASMYYDFRLDGKPILTPFRGKLVDAKVPFVGPAIGHRAKIAGGLNLGPGCQVPNGITVYPNPKTVVLRIPEGLQEGDAVKAGE